MEAVNDLLHHPFSVLKSSWLSTTEAYLALVIGSKPRFCNNGKLKEVCYIILE